MKKHKVLLVVVGVVFGLVLVAFSYTMAAPVKPKTLKIGVTGSMSGAGAGWGLVIDRGVALAVREINEAGGVTVAGQTYLLEQKTYDHAYNPTRSLEVTKRLYELDKVDLFITHGTTAVLPLLPYLEKNKLVTLHAGAGRAVAYLDDKPLKYVRALLTVTPPAIPYLFYPFLREKFPNVKRVVTLNADDASGHEAAKDFTEAVPKFGVEVAALEFYPRGTVDFYPILTRMFAKDHDALELMNCPPGDQGRLLKQARELGYNKPIFACTAPTYGPQLEIAGKAAEGWIFAIEGMDPRDPNAPKELKDHFDRWVVAWGEASYDTLGTTYAVAAHYLTRAIKKAGKLDPDAIMKALDSGEETIYGTKYHFGGQTVYGYKACLIKPNSIMQVVNGKPTVLGVGKFPPNF